MLKDPQRMYNYYQQAETEAIALASKALGILQRKDNLKDMTILQKKTANVKNWVRFAV